MSETIVASANPNEEIKEDNPPPRYWGKFRGTVVLNIDPYQQGRLLVRVPDVFGEESCAWTAPTQPLTGLQSGAYMVPPVNANVWVEFEQGDSNNPVWSGCFWGSSLEVPPTAFLAPPFLQNMVLQSSGQNTILMTDVPGPTGGIIFKTLAGVSLIVNDTGIYISNGKGASIVLTGPTVTINAPALAVT
jgi:hypothetical protein